jgi:hypothetical protein
MGFVFTGGAVFIAVVGFLLWERWSEAAERKRAAKRTSSQ